MPIGTYTRSKKPPGKSITQFFFSNFLFFYFHFRCILLQISHQKCFFISISIPGRETRSYRFGLIDKSQHSRSDNIIDDALFINTFLVTMLIHDSNSSYNSSY